MRLMADRPPLTRYGLALIAAFSGISAVCVWLVYQTRQPEEASADAMLSSPMAAQIEQLAETLQLQARAISLHPNTLACFDSGNGAACRDQAANLYALHPRAALYLVQGGQNAELLPGFLSDGTRRLIERAARDSKPASAADFRLTVTQPVINPQGRGIGFVVLEQAMPELQALFDTLPLPTGVAYAELKQNRDNETTVLMRRGNQAMKRDAPSSVVALAGTPWRIEVWHKPQAMLQAALPYVFAWVLLTMMIAVIVMAVLTRMRDRITGNLKVMTGLINDMRLNRLRNGYPCDLEEFERPMRTMLKIAGMVAGRQKQVSTEATLDHLSQVYNRRSFEQKQSELFKTLKEGWTHSLLLLDIDNFKQINDTFGHEAGDQMIVAFGRALKDNLRSSDFIARLGGDEFCVIFPYTTLERAQELAERLRKSMPEMVDLIPGVTQKLAWSGGLSEYSKDDVQENMALSRADAALLEAKRGGRNNTRVKAAA